MTTKITLSEGVYADNWSDKYAPDIYIDAKEWLESVADFEDEVAVGLMDTLQQVRDENDSYRYEYEVFGLFLDRLDGKKTVDPNLGRKDYYSGQVLSESYSRGAEGWTNTYNHDNDLDNTLELRSFEYEDVTYLAVREHLGGDVRGGYDSIRIGRVYDDDPHAHFYGWQIQVYVMPHEPPQKEQLFDTPPAVPLDFEDRYDFYRWLEDQDEDLDLDVDSIREGKPRLTDGRKVYFDNPYIY